MAAEVIRLEDPAVAIRLRRCARARRFTLSVRAGEARLTAPQGAPDHETRAFLLRQSGWLREALKRAPVRQSVRIGTSLPVGGALLRIAEGGRGPCRIVDDALLAPPHRVGPAVTAFLKTRAQARIAPVAHDAAARLGRRIGRISFRDTRSRWGSCTARGDLAFSWRLAMAPPEVQDYVALHEAAHLVEMNHGPRFWALVAQLCPDHRARRDWLRRDGARLQAFAFDAP
jgi:predicted metal-dependent hydrolase